MPATIDLPDWRTLGAFPSAALGAVGGIAWAASFRGWMAEIAGRESEFDWVGTFALILLPGALAGLLLGLADYARRTGGRPGWRWLAAAPLLFTAPLFVPGAFEALVTIGIGGGAVAVPLFGILGGYATSRRGPLWLCIVFGVIALAYLVAGTLFALGSFTSGFELPTGADWEPRRVWTGVTFLSLMIVFAVACSLPHGRVVVRSQYRRSADNGTTSSAA
jgi:hypothetical protein